MSSSYRSTDNEHLFGYTSGYWLWNGKQQSKNRYKRFHIGGLQKVVAEVVGSNMCISFEKIGEGNYNKAFRLILQDGQRVIAKIPHPNAGPMEYTTASEVATLEFARTVLELPVPKVLAWSATSKNVVESEYIIMEEAEGRQLHDVWQKLELREKRDVIREVMEIEKRMLSISFNRIGSLYFKDCGFAGCEPAKATAMSRGIEQHINSHFSIGPITRREFWAEERCDMHQYHGPWKSAKEYLESVARREIDWLQKYADPKKVVLNPWAYTSDEQVSPHAHISCLRKFMSAVPEIVPKDPELISPRFWHPDFHAGNIYVDELGKISSIIDWQGTWISPLFIGANPPIMLDYSVEMMMKLPENFKQLDESIKEKLRYQVAQSILIYSYENRTAKENPLMHKVMRHRQGKTLKELEAFANGTWDNCLLPFKECLIQMERDWSDFDSTAPCPYHFTEQEVQKHREDGAAFNKCQELWDSIAGVVSDEGYVSKEDFPKAVEIFRDLRQAGLNTLRGEDREEFDIQTRWVLDLRTEGELRA